MDTKLEFLREKQLVGDPKRGIEGILPFSRATLWLKSKSGEFPKPVKLSKQITAWRAEDVAAWIEQYKQAVNS